MHRGIAHLSFIVIGLGGCQGDPAPARARVHGSWRAVNAVRASGDPRLQPCARPSSTREA